MNTTTNDYRFPDDVKALGTDSKAHTAAYLAAKSILEGEVPTPGALDLIARNFHGWGPHAAIIDTAATLFEGDDFPAVRSTTPTSFYTSPDQARHVWEILNRFGFEGGSVLEPGCGHGVFFGARPSGVDIAMTGVDMDPSSLRVAEALYPGQRWVHSALESLHIEDGTFDAVVGNVPFAEVKPYDPVYNRARHSLHNYFILRGLNALKPGGLLAVYTTRYSLDAQSPTSRAAMAELGDLVFAQRFPSNGFFSTAVIVDLLVFRRHAGPAPEGRPFWVDTAPIDVPAWVKQSKRDEENYGPLLDGTNLHSIRTAGWFAKHPELVLGQPYVGRGMYSEHEYLVNKPVRDYWWRDKVVNLARERAAAYLDSVDLTAPSEVIAPPAVPVFEPEVVPADAVRTTPVRPGVEVGMIDVVDGAVCVVTDSALVTVAGRVTKWRTLDVPAGQVKEVAALAKIRDAARAVLDAQRVDSTVSEATFEIRLAELNVAYDAYVAKFGAVTRFTEKRKVDEETGEVDVKRTFPKLGGFREDPYWPLLTSLERFDDNEGTFAKGRILLGRVTSRRTAPTSVATAVEAMSASLSQYAEVRLDYMSELTGRDGDALLDELGDLVYLDPVLRKPVAADLYLSGEVRHKLSAAQTAAETDPSYRRNVTALEAVVPEFVPAEDIDAQLGSPWVPHSVVEDFIEYLLGEDRYGRGKSTRVIHSPHSGGWRIEWVSNYGKPAGFLARWGAAGHNPIELIEACLNSIRVTVTIETHDHRKIVSDELTAEARGRQDELQAEFAGWIWTDEARADRLSLDYNLRFNSYVSPKFNGSHLTLPGLAEGFTPHAYQLDAIWRTIAAGDTLLAIPVGAGKTFCAAGSIMELRRLGKIRKGMLVVPNHLLDQATAAFLSAYPNAKVLMATREMTTKKERGNFIARATTGDFDCIVITLSAFTRLNLSPRAMAEYMAEEIDKLAEARESSTDTWTTKQIEKMRKRLESKHEALLKDAEKDNGLGFEVMGVDYLVLDEFHYYRNLMINSSIRSAANPGSQRAEDLAAKLHWLRRATRSTHVILGLTATPIMNRVSEMWVMGKLIAPHALVSLGMDTHDAWAAMFARTVSLVEVKPEGNGFHTVDRFARFANLPELFQWWFRFAEAKTDAQLGTKKPKANGSTVVTPRTESLAAVMAEVSRRAVAVRNRSVTPEEDNLLAICTTSRMAALDPRLADSTLSAEEEGKLATAAFDLGLRWLEGLDRSYLDPAGNAHPRPGDLQLVFCDLGTPGARKNWTAYGEIRRLMVDLGVPGEEIAFVQDYSTDAQKAELFARCRDGRVRILIGSTETMGTGLNVAERMATIHHLTPPQRPLDLDQRDGRGLRPGNQNASVDIVTYVTEGSGDAFNWELLTRKAGWLAQLTYGAVNDAEGKALRTMEALDVDDRVSSYAQLKAIAVGDPLVVRKAELDGKVATLRQRFANWRATQSKLRSAGAKLKTSIDAAQHEAEGYEKFAVRGVDFAATAPVQNIPFDDLTARAARESKWTTYVGRHEGFSIELYCSYSRKLEVNISSAWSSGPKVEARIPGDLNEETLREAILSAMRSGHTHAARILRRSEDAAIQLTAIESQIEEEWVGEADLEELMAEAARLQAILLNDTREPVAA